MSMGWRWDGDGGEMTYGYHGNVLCGYGRGVTIGIDVGFMFEQWVSDDGIDGWNGGLDRDG